MLTVNYTVNNIIINRVESMRDLCIHFASNLSFSVNTNLVIGKTFKMYGFVGILGNLETLILSKYSIVPLLSLI